jgi:hypothetical protein
MGSSAVSRVSNNFKTVARFALSSRRPVIVAHNVIMGLCKLLQRRCERQQANDSSLILPPAAAWNKYVFLQQAKFAGVDLSSESRSRRVLALTENLRNRADEVSLSNSIRDLLFINVEILGLPCFAREFHLAGRGSSDLGQAECACRINLHNSSKFMNAGQGCSILDRKISTRQQLTSRPTESDFQQDGRHASDPWTSPYGCLCRTIDSFSERPMPGTAVIEVNIRRPLPILRKFRMGNKMNRSDPVMIVDKLTIRPIASHRPSHRPTKDSSIRSSKFANACDVSRSDDRRHAIACPI